MKSVLGLGATIRSVRGPLVLFGGVALAAACQSNSGGLDRESDTDDESVTTTSTSDSGGNGGSGGSGAAQATTSGGSGGSQAGGAGEAGADTSGDSDTTTTSSTSGGDSGGATGSGGSTTETNSGGNGGTSTTTTSSTSGDAGGSGGTGGSGEPVDDCTFHTDPAVSGGEGGAGAVDIQTAESNIVGLYLADGDGRSLYIYGADYPGDCANPPVSNCVNDCLLSWPVFEADARMLGEGLDDAAFGSFLRADGVQQTTYMGWPLYYYKNDLVAGDLFGQGRGKTWDVAEFQLPNIMVMRASEADGGIKYLATGSGHTLYAYAGDVLGTDDDAPESACVGECLNDYVPFTLNSLRLAPAIDPGSISVFVREDSGELQVAYKGAPLYTTDLDDRSGQLQGVATDDWSVVEL